MRLTPKNVQAVLVECLFLDEELTPEGDPRAGLEMVLADGIAVRMGFHKARLEAQRDTVKKLLDQLPSNFRRSDGGGWSFLNLCTRSDGTVWGEQCDAEDLLLLGNGLGLMEPILARGAWHLFPGGVPYFVYNDVPAPVVRKGLN